MSTAFEASLPFVLRWEGGYVNHPADPGGATNKGVTQKVYDGWRVRNGLSAQDVRLLSDTELQRIYEEGYWRPPRCDVLPDALALAQFDTAVNMGVGRAVRFLQRAVGAGVDGDFGSGTLKAVEAADPGATLVAYCDIRRDYYESLVAAKPALAVFRKGWMNRLNALRAEIGLPGAEAAGLDFGDTYRIARIPDVGEDDGFDF